MKRIISAVIASAVMISAVTSAAYAENTNYFSSELNEIEELIDDCHSKGISTDYEDVCFSTMQRFAGYIADDEAKGYNSSLIAYDKQAMLNMYNETKSNLDAYLSGNKNPLSASLDSMRNLTNDGFSLFESHKPVYSIGYGHFNTAIEDIENFRGFGANNIQFEVGPDKVQPIAGDDLPSWTFLQETASGTSSQELTKASATDGQQSLKITVSDTTVRLYQNLFLETGYHYNLSLDVKGSKGISIKAYYGGKQVSIDHSGNWRTVTVGMPANNISNHLPFYITVSGTGTAYIDNVKVCKENEADNYVLNGSFEDKLYGENIAYALKALAKATDSNVGVSVLLSPHNFPEDLEDEGLYTSYPEFIQYNIDSPKAREIIEDYLRYLMPIISKYDCVTNICLSNEPLYDTRFSADFYNPKFREYLRDKYGTIESLNSYYGTSYQSFDSTSMPVLKSANHIDMKEALAYDWVLFNRRIFADWHKWMADIIKEYTDIPLNTKMGSYLSYAATNEWLATAGTDAEKYAEFLDWAGNDAAAYIDEDDSILNKMMWYDFLRTTTNKPVYNSEDHIIKDGNFDFSEHQTKNLVNDLWQGAIHGRAMSTIWVWERSYSSADAYSGSVLLRPDCVWQAGKTGLDLSRLSEYIYAINAEKSKTAIFYSDTSAIYDSKYLDNLLEVYKTLLTLGEKVDFVTENTLDKLGDYDTVIAYGVGYAAGEVRNALFEYSKSGKRLICRKNDFEKNEYAKTVGNGNMVSNAVIADNSNLRNLLSDEIKRRVIVVDNQTGIETQNIEYEYSIDDSSVILNMTGLNYGESNDVSVYLDGRKLTVGTELINNVPYTEKITVSGLEPVLLSFDIKKNTEAPGNPKNLKVTSDGTLMWKNSGEYTCSTVIYDEVNNSFIAGTTANEITLPKFGTYRLRAKSFAGIMSDPVYITYESGNIFDINISDISYKNGRISARVTAKNKTEKKAYGAAKISVFDASGNEIASACVEGLYCGNGEKTFIANMVCEGNPDNVSASVMSTRIGGTEYSEKHTERVGEAEK